LNKSKFNNDPFEIKLIKNKWNKKISYPKSNYKDSKFKNSMQETDRMMKKTDQRIETDLVKGNAEGDGRQWTRENALRWEREKERENAQREREREHSKKDQMKMEN
jgi:hypothetical protein